MHHMYNAVSAALIVDKYEGIVSQLEAQDKLPGASNGPGDAVRHAGGSCEITRATDGKAATEMGNAHENWEGNPAGERQMDQHNNAVGRANAEKSGSCFDNAMDSLHGGDLITAPGNPPAPFSGN
jgi:hypothetical protein